MKTLYQGSVHSRRKLNHAQNQTDRLENIGVLNLIEPARELLEGNWRFNSIYLEPISSLPPIMQFSEDLCPLGEITSTAELFGRRDHNRKIYQKNMKLSINPLQTHQYFKKYRAVKTLDKNISMQPLQPKLEQLVFDSNFESGNLLRVEMEPLTHRYHLYMQNDINTYGCTQWFFFKAVNKEYLKATFFINNFYKAKSLYQRGMKIMIFSKKKSVQKGTGWFRGGQEICYFKNFTSENMNNNKMKNFYSLRFSYYFQHEEDQVFFAYNYPYTYSRLNSFINETMSISPKYITHRMLCKTIADNKVSLLTITDLEKPKFQKKSIFISSRVHPGETVSSLMMEGIIEFLVGGSQMAQKLREKFIFKLIPMLNPDGVIHGNYRTNLAGYDLNRVWQNPDKVLCPEIFQLKKYIIQFHKQCQLLLFCDLHGHSTKKSAFFYGCSAQDKIKKKKKQYQSLNQEARLFPFMLSKTSSDFNFKYCDFSVQKNKEGTARVEIWKQLGIPNIFTLQASFCSREDSEYHFRPKDYKDIGYSFCVTLFDYFCNEEKKQERKAELKEQLQSLMNLGPKINSSDSQSSNDLFDDQLRNELSSKNGQFQIPRRSLIIRAQDSQNKKVDSLKRTVSKVSPRKSNQRNKTEMSNSYDEQRQKKSYQNYPVTKISVQTQCLKGKQMKFPVQIQNRRRLYTDQSLLQKVEHTYRGKSSLYRIKRRGQLLSIQPQRKQSVYKLDYFS